MPNTRIPMQPVRNEVFARAHAAPLCQGVLSYERGFEVVEIEGWMLWEGPWVIVIGDPDRPVFEQPHTAIPLHRVIDTECRETLAPAPIP